MTEPPTERVAILEEMYEYHLRESTAGARCILFAGDHYTYRDIVRAHQVAAEWTAREHMGILKYSESRERLHDIEDRVYADHKRLLEAERIAE